MNYKKAKAKWFKKNVFSFALKRSNEELFFCNSKECNVLRVSLQAFENFGGKFDAETFFNARSYAIKQRRSFLSYQDDFPTFKFIWEQKHTFEYLMDFETYRTRRIFFKYFMS